MSIGPSDASVREVENLPRRQRDVVAPTTASLPPARIPKIELRSLSEIKEIDEISMRSTVAARRRLESAQVLTRIRQRRPGLLLSARRREEDCLAAPRRLCVEHLDDGGAVG